MHRRTNGTLIFADHPEFTPNLTPYEIFRQGAFGGIYWRPIYSGIAKKKLRNVHKKYKFLEGIQESFLSSETCDLNKNKYKVHSGTSLEYWEEHGWITAQDPYGWVQWYCEFYSGRRTTDDARQIRRWLNFAGPNGRFLRRLVGMVKAARSTAADPVISPVIRQGLHHWAKQLTPVDIR